MFYYRSAIKRARPTHRSDRSNDLLNRPRRPTLWPTSRPTMNGIMHFLLFTNAADGAADSVPIFTLLIRLGPPIYLHYFQSIIINQ